MDRQEWLEQRRGGIGGSDVAGILGLSKWSTPLDVYLSKIGQAEEKELTPAMYWGNILESVIRDEFQCQTGIELATGLQPIYRARGENGFMLASLDGLTKDGQIVECKTARSDADWGEAGSGEIPVYYQTQVQHYMSVLGAQLAYVPVLIGGSDFRIYVVERDQNFIEDMIEAERAFWFDHVCAKVPPDPLNATDAKKIWPRDSGDALEVDEVTAEFVAKLKSLKQELKALEEHVEFFDDRVRLSFKDAAMLTHKGVPLATYKAQDTTRIDTKLLELEHPHLAKIYKKTTTSRVLRIK